MYRIEDKDQHLKWHLVMGRAATDNDVRPEPLYLQLLVQFGVEQVHGSFRYHQQSSTVAEASLYA